MPLTAEDVKVIQALREYEVLQPIRPHLLDQREGAVIVACGDGDQFWDLYTHLGEIQRVYRGDPRIHVCTRNGGALRLDSHCPLNKPGRSTARDLLDDIEEGFRLKKMDTLVRYCHLACGKCGEHAMPSMPMFSWHFRGREIVEKHFPDKQHSGFVQLDYGDNWAEFGVERQRSSYHTDSGNWRKHIEGNRGFRLAIANLTA